MRILAAVALLATGLSAQIIRNPFPGNISPPPSQNLIRFLQLTTEQVNTVARLNNELQQFQLEKAARAAQVQFEISRELRKETLDPMALGLRQVELEAIRREIEARANETTRQIGAQLTAEQRTRISALEEVLRNQGLACEAVAQRILPGGGPIVGVISATPVYATGCAIPGFRAGDFVFNSTSAPTSVEP